MSSILGTRFGHAAIERVIAGDVGTMVALRNDQIVSVPLAEAASGQKRVERDTPLLATARAVGIALGD